MFFIDRIKLRMIRLIAAIDQRRGIADDKVSAELAIKRAKDTGHDIEGASACSDSFFPFPDDPQKLIDESVFSILTSSGSVKDGTVFDTIRKASVYLYTIPDSTDRGFYAH